MSQYKIEIEGLATFQRELRAAAPEVVAVLKAVNLKAAQMIVDGSIASARSQGSTAAHAFVEGSIRARGQIRGATVTLYGQENQAHPEILGAEFGSLRHKQFKSWRGNSSQSTSDLWNDGGAGYVLHPTIRAQRDKIEAIYMESVIGALRLAFPVSTSLNSKL